MTQVVEVNFGGNRKEFFQWDGEPLKPKTAVIVEVDRGEDFGRVHSAGEHAKVRCRGCVHGCGESSPERSIIRVANESEIATAEELRHESESARRKAMERVKVHGLVMKVTDAEWRWDRQKLTFYFTAEKRVDFRSLVRDLAAIFRTRIELKQIGVRDEARRLGGVGRCGREYCSASWLRELRPVSLGIASDQRLSLNPQQISGACGRLMCCLRYEHEFYVQSRKRFPKEGRVLRTSIGEERVLSCNIFSETVTLLSSDGDTRTVPLATLRSEVASHSGSPRSGTPYHGDDSDGSWRSDNLGNGVAFDSVTGADTAPPTDKIPTGYTVEAAATVPATDTALAPGATEANRTPPAVGATRHDDPLTDGTVEPLPSEGSGARREAEPNEGLVKGSLPRDEESAAHTTKRRRRGRRGGRRLRNRNNPNND